MNLPPSIGRAALALALLSLPHAVAQQPQLVLTDVSAATGLDWRQIDNNTLMGAGGAFLDFDGDGWLDILLCGGDAVPGLYRNVGGGTRFVAVTPSPFDDRMGAEWMCATVADIDDDGDPDVFFGRFGPNALFRNDGGGRFTDITTPLVAGGRFEFTTSAAFGDFDADGNLDLYVGNYITPGGPPPHHIPTPNLLLRGHGDGTFSDATTPVTAGAGTALATTWSDHDGDGDADILVANDFGAFVEPNRIYRNQGAAGAFGFIEVSAAMHADLRIYCMGIAIGDIDRDRDLDYYFTNLGRNVLLRNDGSRFTDVTGAAGVELEFDVDTSPRLLATSWGCGLFDFDSDGWLDLYVSNGHIPADPALANGTRTRNVLYRHDGPSLTFSRCTQPLDDGIGRGAAFGDYDNDGDVDVLQVNVAGAAVLARNDSPRRGHWAGAMLRGRASNADALGARVALELGDFTALREVSRNSSYQSSSDVRLQFGLGANDRIRTAALRWPSGIGQELHDLDVDAYHGFVEPAVTVERGDLWSQDLLFGRLLWFRAELVNHSTNAVPCGIEEQVRAGYDAAPVFGSPGETLWRGAARAIVLEAGARRTLHRLLWVPRAPFFPRRPNLDFVWVVTDAARAIDECKLGVR
ncbi:MAG: CRTAC1 family protein [Planctomycetes bacterium]|nr:CRTAC1 family protein [Planctomycetota bacterium]